MCQDIVRCAQGSVKVHRGHGHLFSGTKRHNRHCWLMVKMKAGELPMPNKRPKNQKVVL